MADILIVDDDEDFASAAARVLASDGHEVRISRNIQDGLASMKTKLPELVVLDVMFPEDSSAGFQLARQIRQEGPEMRKVPILMLTAINVRFPLGFSKQDIDEEWLPIDDFLEKPVDLQTIQQKVASMLRKKQ